MLPDNSLMPPLRLTAVEWSSSVPAELACGLQAAGRGLQEFHGYGYTIKNPTLLHSQGVSCGARCLKSAKSQEG